MPDLLSSLAGGLARFEGAGLDPNLAKQIAGGIDAATKSAGDAAAARPGESADAAWDSALRPLEGGPVAPAFAEVLNDFLHRVNDAQNQGDAMVEALALGEPVDIHQVMLSLTEARNAMDLTLQIRSHVLKAYQDLLQIPL